MLARFALPALAVLTMVAPAFAQGEVEAPAPWKLMTGKNAGAVGTCTSIDGSDTDFDCYLVRCEAGKLTFVYQPEDASTEAVEGMTLTIGNMEQTVPFVRNDKGESTADLGKYPKLLAALTSGEKWADWLPTDSANPSTIFFELTDAAKQIKGVQKSCH